MIARTALGKILVFAIFFVGITTGAVLDNVYRTHVAAADTNATNKGDRPNPNPQDRARRDQDQMAKYLGMGIAPIVAGLAPDMIVVVGEVTRAWGQVGPLIKETVKQHSFTRAETQIVPSDPITQPRLRGTIALVLLKHFGAPAIV